LLSELRSLSIGGSRIPKIKMSHRLPQWQDNAGFSLFWHHSSAPLASHCLHKTYGDGCYCGHCETEVSDALTGNNTSSSLFKVCSNCRNCYPAFSHGSSSVVIFDRQLWPALTIQKHTLKLKVIKYSWTCHTQWVAKISSSWKPSDNDRRRWVHNGLIVFPQWTKTHTRSYVESIGVTARHITSILVCVCTVVNSNSNCFTISMNSAFVNNDKFVTGNYWLHFWWSVSTMLHAFTSLLVTFYQMGLIACNFKSHSIRRQHFFSEDTCIVPLSPNL
jgi:hypothetical protein